ncbi:MAG: hypothetical protein Q7S22_08595 [Candidatus Micrarchaeota archaeon]|nr:hypothetical protein [Candidatus Micrarchaeota archaeon]
MTDNSKPMILIVPETPGGWEVRIDGEKNTFNGKYKLTGVSATQRGILYAALDTLDKKSLQEIAKAIKDAPVSKEYNTLKDSALKQVEGLATNAKIRPKGDQIEIINR